VAEGERPKIETPPPRGLTALVEETAKQTIENLGRSLEGASDALATPAGADLASLLPETDLPELGAEHAEEGALGKLARRLDREADLFRGVALRELARVAWTTRITQVILVSAAIVEAAIAACAAIVAVLGGTAEGRLGLFFIAAAIVATGAAGVVFSNAKARAGHTKLAEDALARARLIEERLFRVGLAMEWRSAGATLYQDALARLERDVSPHERPIAEH
jgi:hypothetical protein